MSFEAEVEKAILEATHGRIGMLKVESREGEVVVHGRCPSFTCKKLVQDSVMPLLGSAKLVNEVEVG